MNEVRNPNPPVPDAIRCHSRKILIDKSFSWFEFKRTTLSISFFKMTSEEREFAIIGNEWTMTEKLELKWKWVAQSAD